MLKLTRKLDYSILIMVHLAKQPDLPLSAKELAESYNLSPSLVANLLKTLSREGLIDSVRGKHGGYRLLRDPLDIRLGEIIRTVEGEFSLTECASPNMDSEGCSLWGICPSKRPLQAIHNKIFSILETTTLSEIAFPSSELLSAATTAGQEPVRH